MLKDIHGHRQLQMPFVRVDKTRVFYFSQTPKKTLHSGFFHWFQVFRKTSFVQSFLLKKTLRWKTEEKNSEEYVLGIQI